MKTAVIRIRNAITGFSYRQILKRIFFLIDPETIHDRMLAIGALLGTNQITKMLTSAIFSYSDKRLEQKICGIRFSNPVGLSAGFDKEAELTQILPSVGFGFMEAGTITGEPCQGNPKPRLWRLKKSKGLLVNYGLKNDGCVKISERLKKKKFRIPLGINVGKTNSPKTADSDAGISDYAKAYKAFADIGSYYAINISCPNAFGGEPFTNADNLDGLLKGLGRTPSKKPVFVKISPDLSKKQVDDILKVAGKHKVTGFICANLTKNRNNAKIADKIFSTDGGISGKPTEDLSNEQISYIYSKTKGKFVIIGCGGIFSAEDAYMKIKLGASLVQLITGMIFEGPQLISSINLGLVRLLKRDGFSNISEAVGKGNKKHA